jgi:hypothetical protein
LCVGKLITGVLLKYIPYLRKEGGKAIASRPLEPKIGAAYRRACKLLLTNREATRTSVAHVVLTGIDWMRVTDKKASGLGVTDSELRAAYRDEVRHGKNRFILFYDPDLRLLADSPWKTGEAKVAFERYRAEMLIRHATHEDIVMKTTMSAAGGSIIRGGYGDYKGHR